MEYMNTEIEVQIFSIISYQPISQGTWLNHTKSQKYPFKLASNRIKIGKRWIVKLSWKTSHALTYVELQELFIIIIIPKIFIINDEKLVTIFLSFFCITLKFHNIKGVPKNASKI